MLQHQNTSKLLETKLSHMLHILKYQVVVNICADVVADVAS